VNASNNVEFAPNTYHVIDINWNRTGLVLQGSVEHCLKDAKVQLKAMGLPWKAPILVTDRQVKERGDAIFRCPLMQVVGQGSDVQHPQSAGRRNGQRDSMFLRKATNPRAARRGRLG
jgi:hypothetical protein